jgi:hypothetical protein
MEPFAARIPSPGEGVVEAGGSARPPASLPLSRVLPIAFVPVTAPRDGLGQP